MLGSGFGHKAPDLGVTFPCSGSVALAQGSGARLDVEMLTGLRVDNGQHADVGQLEFPWVGHLHGDHLVPQAESAQGGRPVGWVQEVGDDDDLAPPPQGIINVRITW